MMRSFKRMNLMICCFWGLLLLPVSGCAGRQSLPIIFENNALKEHATAFIFALFKQDIAQVLNYSSYPFYLNHQGLINSSEEWAYILSQTTENTEPTQVDILSMVPYPAERLKTEKSNLWAKIFENRFDDKLYLLVQLQINETQQENVLLLLDPITGKVCGFVR